MRKQATQKFSSLMNQALLEKLRREAEVNGQSVRFLLENAVRYYLEVVLPYARGVRPEILKHIQDSFVENQDLIRRLAKPSK